MSSWNLAESRELYNVERWSEGCFDVNQDGEMMLVAGPDGAGISLYRLAKDLIARGFALPVLVRFPDILKQRVKRLCEAFALAMENEGYHAQYTLIYPIKVNQQRSVVEAIVHTGQTGIEAGSKSEMMAILALSPPDGSIVICNGYKDREYVRLALIGQELGLKTYIVIEKVSELELIVQEAADLNLVPRLGIRVRLASVGKGKWVDSGGEKSKFGLNAAQIIHVIRCIEEQGLLGSLQLMHFHVGSQIPDIHDIQKILSEAARFYAELRALGAPIGIVNAGGGLGVDYEGMLSSRPFSRNYSVEEYATNIIYEFKEICNALDLPHPDIVTETGRAITAHHGVLITNIVDMEPVSESATVRPASADDPEIIQDLWYQLNNINQSSPLEAYHNALHWLNEVHVMFSYGVIDLEQRARAEGIIHDICLEVRSLLEADLQARGYLEVLDQINDKLADRYFANFSLFASAPDAWAVDQLFPIVPLNRLQEYPGIRVTLQDLTCDSDGEFKKYVHSQGGETSLPVHPPAPGEPYLFGIFLVGAYQEILGDMHNLFGNTHSVNVQIEGDGEYLLADTFNGDTVQKVLGYVDFNTGTLLETFAKRLESSRFTREQRQIYLQNLRSVLHGYTYLSR